VLPDTIPGPVQLKLLPEILELPFSVMLEMEQVSKRSGPALATGAFRSLLTKTTSVEEHAVPDDTVKV